MSEGDWEKRIQNFVEQGNVADNFGELKEAFKICLDALTNANWGDKAFISDEYLARVANCTDEQLVQLARLDSTKMTEVQDTQAEVVEVNGEPVSVPRDAFVFNADEYEKRLQTLSEVRAHARSMWKDKYGFDISPEQPS